jgi:adenylate kinase
MRIILLGPPGCGKGTQAQLISEKYAIKHIAIGNIIRQEIQRGTRIGRHAKTIIEKGAFLDDNTVHALIATHLHTHKGGWMLDGYPRTIAQAHAFDKEHIISAVLEIQVPDQKVITRIGQRHMVKAKDKEYTFVNKHDAEEFIKEHGGTLFHRSDDNAETIKKRLEVYHTLTEPLLKHYGKQHKVFLINGDKSIQNVFRDVQKVLDRIAGKEKKTHFSR